MFCVRSWARVVAAGAALVTLAACSGGSNSSSGGGGSNGGANATGDITIGVITSLTGQYSVLGGFDKNTLDLYADQANQAGGINGHKIKLVYADDQTNPTQAVIALKQVLAADPVAIVGPVLSSSCTAIVDKVEQAKVPMVTTCATDAQIDPIRRYTFMATLPTAGMTERLADYLVSIGKKKVAVLYDEGSFGQSGLKSLQKQGKVDIVKSAAFQLTSTTYVPQLTSLKSSGADAIVVWGAGQPLVTIAKEYSQLGSDAPLVMSGAAATPLFIKPAGAAGTGVIMASSLANVIDAVPASDPSKAMVQKLASAYQAKYGEPISQFSADACGAWQVITKAIEKAGADPQKVRDAMESTPALACHGTYKYSNADHSGLAASDVWVVIDKGSTLEATPFSKQKAGS